MRNHRIWQIEVNFKVFLPASTSLWRLLWRQRNASKIQNEKLLFLFPFSWLNKAPWIKHFEYVTLSFACLPKGTFDFFVCEQKWSWSLNIFFKKHAIKSKLLFQAIDIVIFLFKANLIFCMHVLHHVRIMVSSCMIYEWLCLSWNVNSAFHELSDFTKNWIQIQSESY